MSEIAIGSASSDEGTFKRRTMLVVIAVGVIAFVAMLVLGAYAPDLRTGKNGGAHALSNAATGFSGLVRLVEATGKNPKIVRAPNILKDEALAVITPEDPSTDLSEILEQRGPRITLLVFPKWATERDPKRPGWVHIRNLLPTLYPEGILAPAQKLKISRVKEKGTPLRTIHQSVVQDLDFVSPEITQVVSGTDLEPVIVDQKDRIVLAKVKDGNLYILADPDLLNNHGMANARQARAALSLLDMLNSTGSKTILFDVTANGLGHSRSPLRLAFDPPFTAITAIIFVAMLLAGWQALVRFGKPRPPQRAIAFGKAALVDNSAALIRKAGREARLAPRYVDQVRERAAALFKIPSSLKGDELDARLDAIPSQVKFSELAARANSARRRDELLLAARRLNHWLEEVSA